MIIYTYISCYIREHDTAIILRGNGFGGVCQKKKIIEFMAILDGFGVKETSEVSKRRKLAFGG